MLASLPIGAGYHTSTGRVPPFMPGTWSVFTPTGQGPAAAVSSGTW